MKRTGLAVLLAGAAHVACAQAGLAFTVSSARFSDPLPLKALMRNELASAQARGEHNLIYVRDEVRLGSQWSAGVLSAIVRQSATLVADEGAVSVIQDIATPGGPGRSYDKPVNLRMSGFVGAGLAFDTAGRWADTPWSWQAGIQLLSLRRFIERDLHGSVSHDADTGVYQLQAQSGYASDRLKFPFQQRFASSGMGLLFQGGLSWRATEALRLSLRVEDLGRLRWSGLPQEEMTLSSRTSQVDGDGYLVYRPLVTGRNRQGAYSVAAVSTWTFAGEWQMAPWWTALASVRRMDHVDTPLPTTALRWQRGDGAVTVGRLWHERAFSLGVSHGPWQWTLAADRLGPAAHARTVSLSWHAAVD